MLGKPERRCQGIVVGCSDTCRPPAAASAADQHSDHIIALGNVHVLASLVPVREDSHHCVTARDRGAQREVAMRIRQGGDVGQRRGAGDETDHRTGDRSGRIAHGPANQPRPRLAHVGVRSSIAGSGGNHPCTIRRRPRRVRQAFHAMRLSNTGVVIRVPEFVVAPPYACTATACRRPLLMR